MAATVIHATGALPSGRARSRSIASRSRTTVPRARTASRTRARRASPQRATSPPRPRSSRSHCRRRPRARLSIRRTSRFRPLRPPASPNRPTRCRSQPDPSKPRWSTRKRPRPPPRTTRPGSTRPSSTATPTTRPEPSRRSPTTARGGGISRKITSFQDRKRLKDVAQELEVPEGMGVILRTAGASRTKTEIKRDFEYLLRMWETVRDVTLKSTAPTLVYEEGSLVKRSIRDLYTKDIDEIIVAGDGSYKEAKDFMRMLMPGHAANVKPYHEGQP